MPSGQNRQKVTGSARAATIRSTTITPPAPPEIAPQRVTMVREEIELLGEATSDLESTVNHLIKRLDGVLSPSVSGNTDDPPDTFRVPVAVDIRTHRRRVQAATDRLAAVIECLEL